MPRLLRLYLGFVVILSIPIAVADIAAPGGAPSATVQISMILGLPLILLMLPRLFDWMSKP